MLVSLPGQESCPTVVQLNQGNRADIRSCGQHKLGLTHGRTGVEMEALTAVQVGLLTIYDMCKSVDRGMVISDVRLLHKSGGKSGTYEARR